MKKFLIGAIAASFVLTALAGPTMAAPAKSKTHAKMAAAMKCPACGMMMPTHKTATMTVPVKIKGVTYYCCSTCAAGKAHAKAASKKAM